MDHNEEVLPSTVLHWNYRGFTEFPINKIQGDESTITDIYLKENLISRLPSDIGLLEHLESLYLSGNDIAELPKEISKLRCLKCLDISGNRLRRIPEEIGEVRTLKFLILDENELCELPLRLAELRYLRYLSVCDNNLQWLPQRPVYNYHHCEFRFWRNSELKALPYSLWYHMFHNQQARSLNIGCLDISNTQIATKRRSCRLKLCQESKEWEFHVNIPPQYNAVLETKFCSPPSLFEICKRVFYQLTSDAAKMLSTQTFSIYSDNIVQSNYEPNNNVADLQYNFKDFNIDNKEYNENNDENITKCAILKSSEINKKLIRRNKSHYVVADLIEEYYNYLPNFLKADLKNGPISRCENINCKKPVFDFVTYEFCFGKIKLIDKIVDVVLSATFCSKTCADVWKTGKCVVPWTL